ncbi:isthmin 2 [Rhinolophus ferrumequinum]|uniref:Isthmin 2 n=1 Tax=Rhinolophus ferrumequinum TaxID=59479 RepID=A0A7J7XPI1_RHIFE|nr:isthmin 2 [Rhinolophus ferrumequinum]
MRRLPGRARLLGVLLLAVLLAAGRGLPVRKPRVPGSGPGAQRGWRSRSVQVRAPRVRGGKRSPAFSPVAGWGF